MTELGAITHRLDTAIAERDDAQEAAEEYWEAWQDAAVYWKGKCDWQEGEILRLRRQWLADHDRLREALKRYGEHTPGCPHRFDEVERLERGWVRGVGCTCGLTDLVA